MGKKKEPEFSKSDLAIENMYNELKALNAKFNAALTLFLYEVDPKRVDDLLREYEQLKELFMIRVPNQNAIDQTKAGLAEALQRLKSRKISKN